jgi:hypothetical protein
MAIPSGSGTEVLKRYSNVVSNTTQTALTVPAHHIYTLLSTSFCIMGGAAINVSFYIHDGTQDRSIFYQQNIPSYGTFVWDNRLIVTAGDLIKVQAHSAEDCEYYISYIDQDWS